MAYIPDDDDDGPNSEETVCTSSSGSSDVAPTLDRTDEGASIGEREARTSAIPGLDPTTDRVVPQSQSSATD